MPVSDPERKPLTLRLTRTSRRALDQFIAMHGGDANSLIEAIAKRLEGLAPGELPEIPMAEIVEDSRLIKHERSRRSS